MVLIVICFSHISGNINGSICSKIDQRKPGSCYSSLYRGSFFSCSGFTENIAISGIPDLLLWFQLVWLLRFPLIVTAPQIFKYILSVVCLPPKHLVAVHFGLGVYRIVKFLIKSNIFYMGEEY